jgi:molecular chaperone GrpE
MRKDITDEPINDEPIVEIEEEKIEPPIEDFKNKYLRALADMENLRKRLQHEKQETIAYAIDNMLSEFLAPLDNFENALAFTDNLSPELKNWATGFKMIASQFKEVLERHGIRPYDSIGKQFDPHFHEGIETVETDEFEDGTVITEVVKGYKRGERILRVATVKVAKKKENATKGEENV